MTDPAPSTLLGIGAHPDDLEFGCGGILLAERARGSRVHLALCSRGESGTNGDAAVRTRESEAAAGLLKAPLEFLEMGGDAHLEPTVENRLQLAALIRRVRPRWVFAPTLEPDQHPDHAVVGSLVRDAARLARYGKVAELTDPPHAIGQLFFYGVTRAGRPAGMTPLVYDISAQGTAWRTLMECHASQLRTRRYLDLQWARAQALGLEAGVELAQQVWTSDPWRVISLDALPPAVRLF